MNLYTIEFVLEGNTTRTVDIRARNKIEAVTEAYNKLPGWRTKDSVVSINILEDKNNETTAENYRN
jgi:hypothetical protein